MNKHYEVLHRAVDQWGVNAQLSMAQEECAELIQAISKFFRRKPDAISKVIEEIADVKIMITQLEIMFDKDAIDQMVDFKMDRLVERLNND